MSIVDREALIPLMNSYKVFLDEQERKNSSRPFCNIQEEYKRDIADKALAALDVANWDKETIGEGIIGEHAIKAVQKNVNLVGRFQVSAFANTVKENPLDAEKVLYDLYHDHKEQDCFDELCRIFGKKYDLLSYLYFVENPERYLPLRSSIFDNIFKGLGINFQTVGRCSWENYQEFINVVKEVREIMVDYYGESDIDLLDAHSFLWTTKVENAESDSKSARDSEITEGSRVYHKEYGEGVVSRFSEKNVYILFSGRQKIFPYPEALEKGYLNYLPR